MDIRVLLVDGFTNTFIKWYEKLPKTVQSRVDACIENAALFKQGDLKDLKSGRGTCEIRIDQGPGYRVYFHVDQDIWYIVGGGDKKSQKTDALSAIALWGAHTAIITQAQNKKDTPKKRGKK